MASEKILQEKQAYVAELTEKLNGAVAGVLVNYSGITVADDTVLRRQLREAGVDYAVVKNTMLKRAAEGANLNGLDDVLNGTTALAVSTSDYTAAARILAKYAETNESFNQKGGFIDGEVVDVDTVNKLAKLPSKEVLIAQVLGGLNATIAGLAIALKAIAEKKEAESGAAPEA